MDKSCRCSAIVTPDWNSANACLPLHMFLSCAADGTRSINSSLLSRSRFGKRRSKRWNLSGTPLHRVTLPLTGHNAVIDRNRPDCFSVDNFDMSLPTNSDSAARKFCKYCSTDRLNLWLCHPRRGHQGSLRLLCWWNNCRQSNKKAINRQGIPFQRRLDKVCMILSRKVCFVLVMQRRTNSLQDRHHIPWQGTQCSYQWNVLRPRTSHQIQ